MKVFVAGHNGMVGNAICKKLFEQQKAEVFVENKKSLNLLYQRDVKNYLKKLKPNAVIIAAARVGGIHANNTYPATFIYENLQIQNNLIHSSHEADVQTILFLGSSCIYPKHSKQPINENQLLNGKLEPTNEPYALAKIAGIKMCESYNRQYSRDYRAIMPTNLYGPGDNFDTENGHVIPALIKRIHEAKVKRSKSVVVWGSGLPRREFLYVDDLADACLFLFNISSEDFKKHTPMMNSHINVGTGTDITIKDLAYAIKKVIGFRGAIEFDVSKPDGTPRKLLDVSKLNQMGWKHSTPLIEGLTKSYAWFKNNI